MNSKNDLILTKLQDSLENDTVLSKNDMKIILDEYKNKLYRTQRIINQSDKQQLMMLKLNEELDEHKNNLEKKVQDEIAKRIDKEKILLEQSRLASMGEMIDAIAHQWKQPLNVISGQVVHLMLQFQLNKLDEERLKKFENNITAQIQHMTDTLNEFRNFFRPSKDMREFSAKEMIENVLLLVKDEFSKNSIDIIVNCEKNFTLYGIENEFKHLMINIINNAKDVFIEKQLKDRKIYINCLHHAGHKAIEIIDNAGGVPQEIINDIFKANITTKEPGKGTGIGLYMSSLIAKKHNGTLSVENVENGAKFLFQCKEDSNNKELMDGII